MRKTILLSCTLIFLSAGPDIASPGSLTEKELNEIYQKPWECLQKLLSDFLPLKVSGEEAGTKIGFNYQVIISRINIPETETVTVPQYGSIRYLQYFRFLEDPRARQIRGMDATIKFVLFVVYLPSDEYIVGCSEKLILEKAFAEVNERMLHLSIATRAEVDLSHFLLYSDSQGKRTVQDFAEVLDLRPDENPIYSEFRENIIVELYRQLIHIIESSDSLKAKAMEGITLVCLGCGTGLELKTGCDALNNRFGPVKVFGLEKNSEVIKEARKQYPNYSFIEGDALEAGKYITDCLSQSPAGGLAVVVAVGLLTEAVLPGTYPAHQILQQIARTPVDLLLVASYASLLFNRQSALNAGWLTEIRPVPDRDIYKKQPIPERIPQLLQNRIFILTPASLEQQVKHALSRSHLRNRIPEDCFTTLDLSMTSRPEQLLPALLLKPESQNVKAVDISWSLLTQEQVHDLIQVMRLWNIGNLVYSGFEPWNTPPVSEQLATCPPLNTHKRIDSQYKEELPSVPYFLMKFFDPKIKINRPVCGVETEEQAQERKVSCLTGEVRRNYVKRLLDMLHGHNIQLQATPKDGMCLYHALALPLGESAEALQSHIMLTAIEQSEYLVNNLGFSEVALQMMINTFYSGSHNWLDGNYMQVSLAAIALQRTILLIMPNAGTGAIQYHLFTPGHDGGHYQTLPGTFNASNALVLVQDGNDHYLAGVVSELDGFQLDYVNTQALAINSVAGPDRHLSSNMSVSSGGLLSERHQPLITLFSHPESSARLQ